MKKLSDVCTKGTSNIAQKDLDARNGAYPIYGASGFIKNVDFYHQEKPYIAIVKDGAGVGRVMQLPAKSSVIGTMQYIIPYEGVSVEYLAYALEHMNLSKYYLGAAIPHIYFKDYCNESLPSHTEEEQENIANTLKLIDNMIFLRKQQLSKLDELVKFQFIELFGNPEHNEKAIDTLPMTELCEIIDGDRGANYPKQEEFSDNGFCLFLNAKNVTANGFYFENCMFITEEKDRLLRKGKLSRGDVVLTTRGTLGNLAFYDDDVPYEHIRINSGMVILRMKRDRITERFFIEQFKMQLASIKENIASGSAQPQLPISTMNKIMLLVPDIEEQERFATLVEQTDKSKLAVQQSLDKLETLKKALMQQYFG